MLCAAEVAVYSEIKTKQVNTVWAECNFLSLNLLVHAKSRLRKVKEMRGCWKLNKETLDGSLWRNGFRRSYKPVAGETGE